MSEPTIVNEQLIIDREHLRLLSLAHYLVGGLTVFISCMFIFHFIMGLVLVGMGGSKEPGAAVVGTIFAALFGLMIVAGWTIGGLTIYAGRCLAARKKRMFTLVMAGINCLSFPLGTAFGICTFMVLLRNSVKAMYDSPPALPVGPTFSGASAEHREGADPFAPHPVHDTEEQMWQEMEARAGQPPELPKSE